MTKTHGFVSPLPHLSTSTRLLHKNTNTTLQFASFGTKGNDVVYVFGGDLYYVADVEKPGDSFAVTNNSNDDVMSGVTDWLYEGVWLVLMFF